MPNPFTIADLIEHLKTLPQNHYPVIDGYEWGVGRIDASTFKIGIAKEPDGNEIPAVSFDRDCCLDRSAGKHCAGLGCDLQFEEQANPYPQIDGMLEALLLAIGAINRVEDAERLKKKAWYQLRISLSHNYQKLFWFNDWLKGLTPEQLEIFVDGEESERKALPDIQPYMENAVNAVVGGL